MAEEKVETPAVHGWDAVADIMETFAAFFFIAALVSLRLPQWTAVWLLAMAILLIVAGRIRAGSESRREHDETLRRQAASRREHRDRERRETVRRTIEERDIIISPERIITLAERGAHAAVQAAVNDILLKYADGTGEYLLPGKKFLEKMDRRAGRPRVDRDMDALYEALSEAPIEETAQLPLASAS
jgi:hypothetical protein